MSAPYFRRLWSFSKYMSKCTSRSAQLSAHVKPTGGAGRRLATMATLGSKPRNRAPLLLGPILGFGFGLSVEAKSDPKQVGKKVLDEADALFDANKLDELVAYLESLEGWYDNPDTLWRVARAEYGLSKRDVQRKEQLLEEAFLHVSKALELNEVLGPAHKWAAILLDAVSQLKGTKARIEQTLKVKGHMERAIELTPEDSTSYYLLGEWYYSLSQISWVERKIASVIFASVPEADLEGGLKILEKAEEITPGFYSKNLVLMAKTLMALNREEERIKALLAEVVQKYKGSDKWDDIEAVKEAVALLKKYKVTVN